MTPAPTPAPDSPPGSRAKKAPGRYRVGVMTMEVEGDRPDAFAALVRSAVDQFDATIQSDGTGEGAAGVSVELLAFRGPHLTPTEGAYRPLDFLRIGLTEKLERGVHFLLIVTEVDLSSAAFTSTVALPSRLTNVAVISTKRLDPAYRGEPPDPDAAAAALTALLRHCFGHLLNLPHHPGPNNVMYDFAQVDELAAMTELTETQRARVRRALPREARERTTASRAGRLARWRFALKVAFSNAGGIVGAALRANPIRLLGRLPTLVTTALSVLLVLFFSPEPWDVGSTVELYQLALFSAVAVIGATAALYRAFGFGAVRDRTRALSESAVVTAAATLLSLGATMALLFTALAGLVWLGAATVFPRQLMETWPTVDPAVRTADHLKLSLFVAAIATLAGSLGGRADSRDLVRGVLFVDEET
ncbi:zinc metalloprotease [Alienimonas californiensis]|uniref:Uncharacterized protein n=1 Tax=Alienimonas californiensis TaxID=2527989 RepID=A0A517P961_9PLAN|nr:hypothetical protein [Alienimonas californiensis]QDT15909.1 hypothetical protein CA12_20070 [Alienimonas californiensis]